MMTEDTVNPDEEMIESAVSEQDDAEPEVQQEETKVPLFALQKERQKRKELEIENRLLRESQARAQMQVQPEEDTSYESATKEYVNRKEFDIIRSIEERAWIKNNPEKYEKVNELLPKFLEKRKNLAAAIEAATNRYEEAWELMDKLSPKEHKAIKSASVAPKKEAPGSPSGVPKSSIMNETVDVMSMSDAEFAAWRQSRKRAR